MLHFHLTRYWFDRFKKGFKTTEYRVANARNSRMLQNAFIKHGASLSCALLRIACDIPCKLYCGYPKSNDLSRILTCRVVAVRLFPLSSLPKVEQEFFITRGVVDPKTMFYAVHMEF